LEFIIICSLQSSSDRRTKDTSVMKFVSKQISFRMMVRRSDSLTPPFFVRSTDEKRLFASPTESEARKQTSFANFYAQPYCGCMTPQRLSGELWLRSLKHFLLANIHNPSVVRRETPSGCGVTWRDARKTAKNKKQMRVRPRKRHASRTRKTLFFVFASVVNAPHPTNRTERNGRPLNLSPDNWAVSSAVRPAIFTLLSPSGDTQFSFGIGG